MRTQSMRIVLVAFYALLLTAQLYSQSISKNIHIDQFGYKTGAQKIAVLSNPQIGYNANESYVPGASIQVINSATSAVAFSASPLMWNGGNTHAQSGDKVWWFDFSAVTTPGEYYLFDPANNLRSHTFEIDDDVYNAALRQSMRAFYYQRCGVAKTATHGGNWNDVVCHHHNEQDLDCRLISDPQNVSLSKDLSGGWHDAGDYNKYVNFTHSPLHNLLFAYEDTPEIWGDDFNIPESGNGIPDILDEIKFELDWLLKMQMSDGSVLMKVSVTGFQGTSPPSADMAVRRYGPAQASATRAAASIFAHAAIVYASAGMDSYANTLLARAELAWDWVDANPGYSSYNNAGFSSANPEVSNSNQDDFLACAAAYLFAATGNSEYQNYFDSNYTSINPYAWGYWYLFQTDVQDAMLYYANLPNATSAVASNIQNSFINSMHNNNPDMLTAFRNNTDAYRAQLGNNDYVWGNNREKSYASLMFHHLLKYNLDNGGQNDADDYAKAAAGYMHFVHGVNPINKLMLSNMYAYGGDDCANEIYHVWFGDGTDFDNALTSLYGPAPGIVPGGMNPNYAPAAAYVGPPLEPPVNQPIQKSYKDWNTSYPENSWEITENSITYQAAYVNMLSKQINQAGNPLPIVLTDFEALLLHTNHVQITWKTLTESNNDFFQLEKSTDGITWSKLQKVQGAGTSEAPTSYITYDETPATGYNYYRLKQVDLDGQYTYSNSRSVYFDNSGHTGIKVHPNPADKRITISFPQGHSGDVRIFNIFNQEVMRYALVGQNETQYDLDISKLSKGVYYIVTNQFVQQFMKQ